MAQACCFCSRKGSVISRCPVLTSSSQIWQHGYINTWAPGPGQQCFVQGTASFPWYSYCIYHHRTKMLGPRISSVVSSVLALSGLVQAVPHAGRAAWPNGPFVTSGRYIRDASGTNLTYAGVNWPGHGEVMIPEGLQYQSIETIVGKIKSLGMNAIRLTYAIEMIDQIYDNNGDDIPIDTALTTALGSNNGMKVLDQIIANNPQFSSSTTRLQVNFRRPTGELETPTKPLFCRCSMPLSQNARSRRFISTWITISPRACGAARPMTEIPGGEINISPSTTGLEVYHTWLTT